MNHPRTFGKVEIKLAVMENQMTVADTVAITCTCESSASKW
jgi:hypothetical protein